MHWDIIKCLVSNERRENAFDNEVYSLIKMCVAMKISHLFIRTCRMAYLNTWLTSFVGYTLLCSLLGWTTKGRHHTPVSGYPTDMTDKYKTGFLFIGTHCIIDNQEIPSGKSVLIFCFGTQPTWVDRPLILSYHWYLTVKMSVQVQVRVQVYLSFKSLCM